MDYCQRLFLLLCSSVVELTDFHSHGLFQGSQLPCLDCGVQVSEENDQNLWWLYYSLSSPLYINQSINQIFIFVSLAYTTSHNRLMRHSKRV